MYVASGAISAANPEALKVSAGDSLLGVRGTDPTSFVVEVDRKTSREAGSVVVLVGLVSIQRPDGSIVSVATNQYSRWQPAVTAEPAKALAAAPAEMQGTVSVLQVKVGAEDVPQDIQAAVQEALESLPPTAAGELELAAPTLPTPVAATGITPVLLVFTPGAAGGCVGSPC